jgi:dTDP-L-rhamnose 4-epimerase
MAKRILVTGGAGFIGSHLVDDLIKKGHEVKILDNLEPQVHSKMPDYLNKDAQFIQGDLRNDDDIRKALKGTDIIFHLAAMVGVGQSMYQIQRYTEVNTQATAKLLETIIDGAYGIEKLLVASSMSIYGEGAYQCHSCGVVYPKLRSEAQLAAKDWEMKCPVCSKNVEPVPTNEDKPLYPTSIYAINKRDQEEMCLSIGRAYHIPTVALRYFNTYGTRQSLSNPYTGVAAIFLSRIKNDKPPMIFEDGLQARDFISVHDIVQANILAMEKPEADYEVFNVGTGKPVTILQIADILNKLCGKDLKPQVLGKYRSGDIRHCYADITKIKSKLGFKPKVELDKGMEELIEWSETTTAEDKTQQAQEELLKNRLVR